MSKKQVFNIVMFVEPKLKTRTTMITLITLLISLLGYGTPSDFQHLTEVQLNSEIELAEQNSTDGGTSSWEMPGVQSPN